MREFITINGELARTSALPANAEMVLNFLKGIAKKGLLRLIAPPGFQEEENRRMSHLLDQLKKFYKNRIIPMEFIFQESG